MSPLQWHHARMTEQLRREIAWTIANRLSDPRVPGLVTVMEIKLAPDTRNATIFVSIPDDDGRREQALQALNRAAAFIQRTVASRVSLKNFPRLVFKIDTSIDHGEHINNLLEQVKDDLV